MTHSSKNIGHRLHTFFFRPISAAGFGLMRAAWGMTLFVSFLSQMRSVQRYYGPDGILPRALTSDVLRHDWRFSLLDGANAQMTSTLYWLLIGNLILVTLGIGRRSVMLIALILLFSFHEYATFTLDGGDTLLRLIGFLLLLAPSTRAFSIASLRTRLRLIRETGVDQPVSERTMPIWPYRLLLWQMVLLYISSATMKLHGGTWLSGSAVSIALHHAHFTRLPMAVADWLSVLSPMIGAFTILSQLGWSLLILLPMLSWMGLQVQGIPSLKRALLLCGILIHGGILLTMDVGIFSYVVFTAYLGLLIDDDFRAIRAFFNRHRKRSTVVLYDGRCGFCKKTIFFLSMLDWLHRLEFKNFHDVHMREKYASTIGLPALSKAMHAVDAHGNVTKGFFAFRVLSWEIPVLWLTVPILYVPGVSVIGQWMYGWIAAHRRSIAQ